MSSSEAPQGAGAPPGPRPVEPGPAAPGGAAPGAEPQHSAPAGGAFAPRPFAAFALCAVPGRAPRRFGARRVAQLAAMLRHAALAAARREGCDPAWIEQVVAGHGRGPREKSQRLSYLLLPELGGLLSELGGLLPELSGLPSELGAPMPPGTERRGEADIERVLLLESAGGSGEAARWAQRALLGAQLFAQDEPDPAAVLGPARLDEPPWRAALGPAREWASVTPLVLPGRDDRRPAKTEALLRRAFAQAAWPGEEPEAIAWRDAPFWERAHSASEYFAPQRLRTRARLHVRVGFRAPVAGPLAAGAGRHAGLGLFAATSLFEVRTAE